VRRKTLAIALRFAAIGLSNSQLRHLTKNGESIRIGQERHAKIFEPP
jgi:hypothetical protein